MVRLSVIAAALLAVAGVLAKPVVKDHVSPFDPSTKRVTLMKGVQVANRTVAHGAPITGTMNYGGGPLLTGATNIYYIYYGSSFASSDQDYLNNLASGISSHPYFNAEKTFYSQSGSTKTNIAGPVTLAKTISDNYSLGKSLADADIQSIVTNHIQSGELPLDTSAVYFVLTAADVAETSGFCSQYCGWHNNFAYNGNDLKFAFIGDAASCLSGCSPDNVNTSPHGNPGVDGMASVITHELMEAMSDPDPSSGWTDASGNENADKCAYVYGTELTDSATNSKYNMVIGSYKYLVQQNWDLTLNGCYNFPVSGGTPTTTAKTSSVKSTSTSSPIPPTSSTSPVPPTTTTKSAHTSTSSAGAACHNGDDQCLYPDGTSGAYRECHNGVWKTYNCQSTTGYPNCYQYSSTDVYCDY